MIKRIVPFALVMLPVASSVMAKTVVIAQDATWPQMEFVDENQQIIGFDTDHMKAAAKGAGFDVEFKNVAWNGSLPAWMPACSTRLDHR